MIEQIDDFEKNRLGAKENQDFLELNKNLVGLRDFLNELSYLSFGRDMSFIAGVGTISGAIVIDSAIRTLESIRLCCLNTNMADAYTLARKYRDDLFYYIYLFVVGDKQDILKVDVNNLDADSKNVRDWLHNQQKDLHIGDVLKCIASAREAKEAIRKYELKKSFDRLADQLNNYVHSNGCAYYNISYSRMHYSNVNIKKQCEEFWKTCEFLTMAFLFILVLVRPIMIMSYDYTDYLDCGDIPPEDSQYWVAPFITDFIQKHKNVLDTNCDEYLKKVTLMEI